MNMRIFTNALAIARQLHRIGNKVAGWLSDSGKGIKECTGMCRHVVQTARGLAIVLHTGKRVCWRVNQSVADVVSRLTSWNIEQTDNAISLAMAQVNDGGMTNKHAVDAACEVYPNADRNIVSDVLTSWV